MLKMDKEYEELEKKEKEIKKKREKQVLSFLDNIYKNGAAQCQQQVAKLEKKQNFDHDDANVDFCVETVNNKQICQTETQKLKLVKYATDIDKKVQKEKRNSQIKAASRNLDMSQGKLGRFLEKQDSKGTSKNKVMQAPQDKKMEEIHSKIESIKKKMATKVYQESPSVSPYKEPKRVLSPPKVEVPKIDIRLIDIQITTKTSKTFENQTRKKSVTFAEKPHKQRKNKFDRSTTKPQPVEVQDVEVSMDSESLSPKHADYDENMEFANSLVRTGSFKHGYQDSASSDSHHSQEDSKRSG